MTLLKEYLDYLRDNPKGYWFKRKLFGWGWVPVSWQGWVVILALTTYLLLTANIFPPDTEPTKFIVCMAIAIVIIIVIGFKKGEPPRWQWGLKKNPISDKQTK